MTGWRRWAVALATLVAGMTAMVVAIFAPGGLQSVAVVGGLVAAMAPLVVGLVVWARRPAPVALATSTVEQTDAAQRQLASHVLGQWRDEINVRQLDDPGPLTVWWRFTELEVVDRAEHITRDSRSHSRGRPRFTGRTDRISELTAAFRTLKRRRLVILGEAGMGKTTLAVLMLRELLERAEPGDPVPVLLSLPGWDPRAESLSEWLVRRLAEDYPALRAAAFGPDAARSLVTNRRVLPVLDGFDEQPDEVRPAILARLNENAADPLVLTSRTAEYQSAVTAPGGDALTGGAVIEPNPVNPADAANYIAGCLPPGTNKAWQGLLTTLRDDAGSPISSALSTPLALWLLRKVYVDTRTDPADLWDTSRFPTADTVVEHLLDKLVDVLIGANPPRRHDDAHLFRPRHAWNTREATRWLAFLAHHMNRIGSRDLAWWQLQPMNRRVIATAGGLLAGTIIGIAAGIADALEFGLVEGVADGLVQGAVFGLAVGLATGLTVWLVLGLVFGLFLLGASVSVMVTAHEPVLASAFGIAGSIPITIVIVLAVKCIGFTPAKGPAFADLRLHGRIGLLRRRLTSRADGRLLSRFTPGFAVGFGYGLVLGVFDAVSNGLVTALVIGFGLGLAAWLAIGFTDWAETPLTDERPQTPVVTFRRDLNLIAIKSLVSGIALGLAFGIALSFLGVGGLATAVTMGLYAAFAVALGVGFHQASGRYLVTVSVLRLQRRTLLRLLSFLDDAHRLGILRQAGPVYQFRHAKLQDHLAQTYTTSRQPPLPIARVRDQ